MADRNCAGRNRNITDLQTRYFLLDFRLYTSLLQHIATDLLYSPYDLALLGMLNNPCAHLHDMEALLSGDDSGPHCNSSCFTLSVMKGRKSQGSALCGAGQRAEAYCFYLFFEIYSPCYWNR